MGDLCLKPQGRERDESTYCTRHVYKICMETGGSRYCKMSVCMHDILMLVIIRSQNVSYNVSMEKIDK